MISPTRSLDRVRRADYGSAELKILTGIAPDWVQVASYADGWQLIHIEDIPTGSDYFRVVITDDDGTRADILNTATGVALNTYVYKRMSFDPPKYDTLPTWEYKAQITGMRLIPSSPSISPSASESPSVSPSASPSPS